MNNKFFKKNNTLYIIAGKMKGRKISFNYIFNLRPTMNRIRETLFNWLSVNISDARCLDCFAGSGILGIEAISRNAASVTSLEIEKKAVIAIKKNIENLQILNLNVIQTNSIYWLKKKGTPYDIVFIDPPYNQGLIQKIIILLEKYQWLKENSMVYIEKEKNTPLIMSKNWTLHKKTITSHTVCYLYIFNIEKI